MTKASLPAIKVTPRMRQKVDDLAIWLAAGDQNQIGAARRAIVELLCAAAGGTPEQMLKRVKPKR